MGAEWVKIRSVRSTIWTLTAMTVLTLGVAVIAGATIPGQWYTFSASQRATFGPTSISLKGLLFGQLVIGVLGVMVMSAEYGTGTIRATLAAIPNRPLIVATKAAVFAMIAAVVGQVLSFVAFFVAQALLSSPAPHASLGQPGVLRAVVGSRLMELTRFGGHGEWGSNHPEDTVPVTSGDGPDAGLALGILGLVR
jgi:hypothetical protein